MATIINNQDTSGDNSGLNLVVAVVVLIILAIVFFAYGLPALRNASAPKDGATINVPEKVDVNINNPAGNY